MKRKKLNFRFHDPNPPEVTAEYLMRILVESNAGKVEQALQDAAREIPESSEKSI